MKMRRHIPLGISALAVASMVVGFLAIAAPEASAQTNTWYVATTGSNTLNSCANQARPCRTISYALTEQAGSLTPGTIHVAAGTYTEQLSITTLNDHVKIQGAGSSTVIQPPSAGLLSDTDTDSSNPQYYVIDVAPGAVGVKLKKLSVNGLNGIPSLDADGNGCSQDYVGIYYHEASGSITDVSVNGIDMPANLFGCQGGQGIYVNSGASPATVTMSKVSLLTPAPVITTTADLPAGTYTNDQLATTKLPAGFTSGPVTVNGMELSAARDTSKVLFVTGTTSIDSPSGSTVHFDPYTPAYDKNGITCDDANTTCTITNSTVQGEGETNMIAQNGIQGFGAAAITISGSTVSNDTYSGGGEGNSASGILILNAGTVQVQDNQVSDSDVNIYAGEVAAYDFLLANPPASAGAWNIGGNSVSGATATGESAGEGGYGEGIQLDGTSNAVVVEGNAISTSAQSNLLLTGVTNAGVGIVGAGDNPNDITDSQSGIVVGGPGSECEFAYGASCNSSDPAYASSDNAFIGNTVNSGGAGVGVLVQGAYAPNMFGGSDPGAAYGNNFAGNTWNDNAINVIDFSGYNNPGPPYPASPASAPLLNQYGPNDPNSVATNPDNTCDPTPGGSSLLAGLAGGPLFYSC